MNNLKSIILKDKLIHGRERKNFTRILFSSVFSIVVALICALVLATALGYQPLNVFVKLFTVGFSNPEQLFTYIGTFTLAGFAFAITFKGGIFNIGISGQMMAAGTSIIFLIKLFNHYNVADNIPNGAGQVIIVLLAMLVGSLISLIVGSLDVFLKVNSVVSAILLNWIIYFTCFYLIATFAGKEASGILVGSELIPDNFRLIEKTTDTGGIIPIVVIMVVVAAFMLFIFKFTVFGHKIKAIGFSSTASTYSGYKVKKIKLLTFIMSGSISGLLACVVYTTSAIPTIPLNLSVDAIPTEGFDGIAIALIGYNNPVSIILISSLFGLFKTSMLGIQIPPAYFNLLIGFIMIGATLSTLIVKWKPWCYIKTFYYNKHYYQVQDNFDNQFIELMSKYQSILRWEKHNIYTQNIDKYQKDKLWEETLIEIKEDYLTERKKVMEYHKFEKINMYIDHKLDICGKYAEKINKIKNMYNLVESKKVSKYRERIHILKMRVEDITSADTYSEDKVNKIWIQIQRQENKIKKIENKYQSVLDNNVNKAELEENIKLINKNKLKKNLHDVNLKIATVTSHSQREYFTEKINKYMQEGGIS